MRFRLRPDQIDKVLLLKGEHLCFCVHYMDFDRKTIVFEMGQNCLTCVICKDSRKASTQFQNGSNFIVSMLLECQIKQL